MKLYKEKITKEDKIPSDPELIFESASRDSLKAKANELARKNIDGGDEDLIWLFEGNDTGYTELLVNSEMKFVIR